MAGMLGLILYVAIAPPAAAGDTSDSASIGTAETSVGDLGDSGRSPVRLDVGCDLRMRYEYQDGFDVRGYKPEARDQVLLTRVMFDFNLRLNEESRVMLQLRDARAFWSQLKQGDFPSNNPLEDWCDIRQAFVEWLHIAGGPIGIKAGRQQISYGDQRVFGPGLWGNTGRYVWDALMLKTDLSFLRLDMWAGRYVKNRPDRWPNRTFDDPTAFVAYGSLKNIPVQLDIFHAVKYDGSGNIAGEHGRGNLQSYSSGIQTRGQVKRNIDYTATFVYQFGKYGGDNIRAYGANAGIGIAASVPWKTRLAGQFTWGSGDSDPYDGKHETFDGVFGGADINFYGDLNLFYWANLRDYELDLHLTPREGIRLVAEYHYFTLDRARDAWYTTGLKPLRRDTLGNSGTSLGHELNLRVVCSAAKTHEFMFGYGHFFPGSFVQNTGSDTQVNGLFLQSTYLF